MSNELAHRPSEPYVTVGGKWGDDIVPAFQLDLLRLQQRPYLVVYQGAFTRHEVAILVRWYPGVDVWWGTVTAPPHVELTDKTNICGDDTLGASASITDKVNKAAVIQESGTSFQFVLDALREKIGVVRDWAGRLSE